MGPKPKPSSSIDLSRLGFSKGEQLPQITTEPPPLYPPLQNKPVPVPLDNEEMITITDIYDRLRIEIREDAFHVKLAEQKPFIERYSDHLDDALTEKKYNYRKELFPEVLTTTKKKIVAKAKVVNLDKVLVEDREELPVEPEDAEEPEEVPEEEADEGVDDDYADTYFDNGENFLDAEDDALEESAVF